MPIVEAIAARRTALSILTNKFLTSSKAVFPSFNALEKESTMSQTAQTIKYTEMMA